MKSIYRFVPKGVRAHRASHSMLLLVIRNQRDNRQGGDASESLVQSCAGQISKIRRPLGKVFHITNTSHSISSS